MANVGLPHQQPFSLRSIETLLNNNNKNLSMGESLIMATRHVPDSEKNKAVP